MQAELTALENNHTWQIVDMPPNVIPIGSKQCCKERLGPAGSTSQTGNQTIDRSEPLIGSSTLQNRYDSVGLGFEPVTRPVIG